MLTFCDVLTHRWCCSEVLQKVQHAGQNRCTASRHGFGSVLMNRNRASQIGNSLGAAHGNTGVQLLRSGALGGLMVNDSLSTV